MQLVKQQIVSSSKNLVSYRKWYEVETFPLCVSKVVKKNGWSCLVNCSYLRKARFPLAKTFPWSVLMAKVHKGKLTSSSVFAPVFILFR